MIFLSKEVFLYLYSNTVGPQILFVKYEKICLIVNIKVETWEDLMIIMVGFMSISITIPFINNGMLPTGNQKTY